MISASPETIELCKQLEPSFWTLAKPHLAEAFVPFIVFVGLVLILMLGSIVAHFSKGSGI